MRRLFGGRRLFSSAQPPHPPKRPLLGRALSRTRLFLTGGRTLGRGDRLALGAGLILVGPGLLLLGDTTSAVSVCLTATGLLSLKLQDSVLSVLASYLWHSTGLLITLESLPKPQWKKGRLRFENVKILLDDDTWKALLSEQAQAQGLPIPKDTDVDVNWTYWDLKIQTLDLSLSLVRWMDGKGILKDMSLQGVRGTVRRSHITWDENWVPSRRSPSYGDFELSHLKLSDVLLTLENPRQKPYNLSVYHASLPTLRKQYLLYDFFCADSMVGVVDGCLFSVHRPQQLSTDEDNGQNSARKGWGKMSHLKINGLSVDHFKAGVITGPLSWITKGTLDLDLHLWIPQAHPTDDLLDLIRTEVTDLKETALDSIERMVVNHPERESVRGVFERKAEARRREMWERKRKKARREMRDYGTMAPQDVGSEEPAAVVLSTDTNGTPETAKTHKTTPIPPVPTGPPSLVMFWTVKMNNFKASVPLKPKALSYMSSALIRPVVAFMNSNRTQLEISFDAKMDITNFNGAWDVYTAGLAQILSEELGRALLSLTQDEKERRRRLYQIGLWSIQSVTKQLMEVIEYTRTLGRNATAALGSGVV